MKLRELQILLDQQPSVITNTYVVVVLNILGYILAIGFLILGLGLLIEGWLDWKVFLEWVSRQFNIILNQEQRSDIAISFGIFSLILSLIFGGVIYLSRWILQRNHFIMEMEDWIYNNLSEIKRKRIQSKKKK